MNLYHTSKGYLLVYRLILMVVPVFALRKSINTTESGTMSILPYTAFFDRYTKHHTEGEVLKKSFLSGFKPFEKYQVSEEFIAEKGDSGREPELGNYIDKEILERTIMSAFYKKEYYLTLRKGWQHEQSIHIYDIYMDLFVMMVNMANIPYYSKKNGLLLSTFEINTILSLYEIFALDEFVRIPLEVKDKTGLDMTKRECFKENMRFLIEINEEANSQYLAILREIIKDGRLVLMTEIPAQRLDERDWVTWLLQRDSNMDLTWYLYATLCNTLDDVRKKRVVTYVKETFVLGKKGIQLHFRTKKAPSTDYIGLAHYLLHRNQLDVKHIEVMVQEDLKVLEMQFSSVMEVFRKAEVVYVSSLGNVRRIELNLPLVNIILDIEKKRSERQMERVLKGFVVYDYNSLNEFAKKQLLELNLDQVGFMTEIYRDRCCVDRGHACLFKLNHRPPNFLGKFSIAEDRKTEIQALVSPYNFLFEELNLEHLPNLRELDISLPTNEMRAEYKDSELPVVVREVMNIRTIRLYGTSKMQQSSYLDMFRKSLKILSVNEIDITEVPITNAQIALILGSKDNLIRKQITDFSFTYFDPQYTEYGVAGGNFGSSQSILEKIFIALPNLRKLNVTVLNQKREAEGLLEDFKYLLRCGGPGYSELKIKEMVNIRMDVPLIVSTTNSCTSIVDSALHRLHYPISRRFKKAVKCPLGQNSVALRGMSMGQFILSVRTVLESSMCSSGDTLEL